MSSSSRTYEGEVIRAYTALTDQPNSHENVLAILRRYNLPWLVPEQVQQATALIGRQPVSSGLTFQDDPLKSVHQTPLIYRLAFIRQLSTVALTSHLEATHTRLSHAFGTAETANRMLQRIEASGTHIPLLFRRACVLYAFLHDAFHGPMGHSLDIMRDIFGISVFDKIDDAQFRFALAEAIRLPSTTGKPRDLLGEQIRLAATIVHPSNPDQLLGALHVLANKSLLMQDQHKELVFLRDIIDSALDADRIDYIIRDARALEGNTYEGITALVESVRAVPEGGQLRLAFHASTKEIAVQALTLRRRFYTDYYESGRKLIVDDMICHAAYYILRDRKLTVEQSRPADEAVRLTAIRELLLLVDGDFFPALQELRASPFCYDLITRVLARRYFVSLYQRGLSASEISDTLALVNRWMRAVSSETKRLAAERGSLHYSLDAVQIDDMPFLQEITRNALPDVNDRERALMFRFQSWMRGSFRARHQFERAVWARFCAADHTRALRERYVAQEYGSIDLSDELIPLLDEMPPIHVTMSSYFSIGSRADYGHYPKEGSFNHSVLFYEGNVVERVVLETEMRETQPAFPFIVAVPERLKEVADSELLAAFRQELEACQWFWGQLRHGQRVDDEA